MRMFNNNVIRIFYVWRLSNKTMGKNSMFYSLFASPNITLMMMMMILRPHNSNRGVKTDIKIYLGAKGN
jgi:hypothetical protein